MIALGNIVFFIVSRFCCFKDAGIDLWLSGHTHRYARIDPTPDGNTYTLIVGDTDTMTVVDVSKAELKVRVIRQNGELVDSLTLMPK